MKVKVNLEHPLSVKFHFRQWLSLNPAPSQKRASKPKGRLSGNFQQVRPNTLSMQPRRALETTHEPRWFRSRCSKKNRFDWVHAKPSPVRTFPLPPHGESLTNGAAGRLLACCLIIWIVILDELQISHCECAWAHIIGAHMHTFKII